MIFVPALVPQNSKMSIFLAARASFLSPVLKSVLFVVTFL